MCNAFSLFAISLLINWVNQSSNRINSHHLSQSKGARPNRIFSSRIIPKSGKKLGLHEDWYGKKLGWIRKKVGRHGENLGAHGNPKDNHEKPCQTNQKTYGIVTLASWVDHSQAKKVIWTQVLVSTGVICAKGCKNTSMCWKISMLSGTLANSVMDGISYVDVSLS